MEQIEEYLNSNDPLTIIIGLELLRRWDIPIDEKEELLKPFKTDYNKCLQYSESSVNKYNGLFVRHNAPGGIYCPVRKWKSGYHYLGTLKDFLDGTD